MQKILGYEMLYKFLKEQGIMAKYLSNILLQRDKPKENAKKMILEVVDKYVDDFGYDFTILFNYINSSFLWDASIEGSHFWANFLPKWNKYRKCFMEKHKEEEKK